MRFTATALRAEDKHLGTHRAPKGLISTERGFLIRAVVLQRIDCSGLIFTQIIQNEQDLLLSTADGNRCCILSAGSTTLSSSLLYKPKPTLAGSLHAADAKAVPATLDLAGNTQGSVCGTCSFLQTASSSPQVSH